MKHATQKYKVLPLPAVEKLAKKILTDEQRRAAIRIARELEDFPNVQHLDLEKCGEGTRVAFRSPEINKQGWLRGVFWIVIYFVDIFWKKTNKVATADLIRISHRIRGLRAELAKGIKPWAKAA